MSALGSQLLGIAAAALGCAWLLLCACLGVTDLREEMRRLHLD